MSYLPNFLFLLLLQLVAFPTLACSRAPGSPEPTNSELFQNAKSVFVAHVYRTEEKSWPLGSNKTPEPIVEAGDCQASCRLDGVIAKSCLAGKVGVECSVCFLDDLVE